MVSRFFRVILPVNGLVSFPSHHFRLLKIWEPKATIADMKISDA